MWRKSIEEYIAEASDAAKGSKALLELNTLAMKSRITRKEQLLANVYQNMIDLAEDSTTKLDTLLGDMLQVNYYESCFSIQRGDRPGLPCGEDRQKADPAGGCPSHGARSTTPRPCGEPATTFRRW